MIISRMQVDDDEKLTEMYFYFARTVMAVSKSKLYITKQGWHRMVKINSIKNVNEFRAMLFDVIMPIEDVAEKYGITKEQYLHLYLQNENTMNIPKRREVLTFILNGDIDKINFVSK